jgi:hypothetical protein
VAGANLGNHLHQQVHPLTVDQPAHHDNCGGGGGGRILWAQVGGVKLLRVGREQAELDGVRDSETNFYLFKVYLYFH